MKTLLIVASTLGRDGTSRFITYLANNFTKHYKIKVKLLFFRSVSKESLENINPEVSYTCLNIENKLWKSVFKILRAIVKSKPDYCLIGFHQLLWVSFFKLYFHAYGIKILMRDTIIPSLYHKNEGVLRKFINRKAYQCFDNIITQSIDMREDLINWGCSFNKMILINNPVDIEGVKSKVDCCPNELIDKIDYTFVAAGRLTEQKGYDIIIDRIAEIKERHKFQLLVLGSGELEDKLIQRVKDKGVTDYVHFIGFRKNVASYLYYADALLLCSRYEGFPNIVLEANSLGKPVFANACKGGINEIIVQNKNGISCNFEDQNDFEKGLVSFFKTNFNDKEIVRLTKERYDISVIMDKYYHYFSTK